MSRDGLNLTWTPENKKPAISAGLMGFIGLYGTLLDHEMVEAAGIEPASENRQRKTSTCVATVFNFAPIHAP